MKIVGFIAILFGVIALFGGVVMDTSVPTGNGTRVNNLGLMHQQSNLLLIGVVVLVGGIIMMVASKKGPGDVRPAQKIGYSAEEMKDLQALVSGRGTVGITLSSTDPKVVAAVAQGYPAMEAGVMAGDRIVMIDGEFTSDDVRDNVMRLTGERGADVRISVRRGEAIVDFTMQRA